VSPLLDVLNRLLGEALAQHAPRGAVQVRSVVLDDDGAHAVLQLLPPAGSGEVVLRLRAEPPEGPRQHLVLTVERGPARWPAALEPFRRVIERARLRLELDFSDPDASP